MKRYNSKGHYSDQEVFASLLQRELFLKKRIYSQGEQILFFKSNLLWERIHVPGKQISSSAVVSLW